MYFRNLILICLVVLACLSCKSHSKSPNFILLLTDDQSYHLSMLGVPGLSTPNIDQLASQGVFFEKAYSASASCAPCRTAILTGMHSHSNGHWRNTHGPNLKSPEIEFTKDAKVQDKKGVHEDIPTLVELLKRNGYYTGITEEWHLSPAWKFPYKFKDKANLTPKGSAKAVNDFIDKADGKPFFLQANVDNTHRPYRKHANLNKDLPFVNPKDVNVPPHWPDTEKTRQDYAEYLTTVQHADAVIGAIINEVEKAGLLEDTYFIYTSDQGFCYHRAKATAYDWGVHVPMSITGPGIEQDIRTKALVSHIDIMPTILDFADIHIPQSVQGKTLRPILEGKSKDVGRTTIGSEHNAHGPGEQEYHPTRSITDGHVLLMWNIRYHVVPDFNIDEWATAPDARKTERGPAWMPWDATPSDAWQNNAFEDIIFHKEEYPLAYKLLKESMFRPEYELYDLELDPYETNNLIDDPEFASVVKDLRQELKQWMNETNDNGDPRSIPRRTDG